MYTLKAQAQKLMEMPTEEGFGQQIRHSNRLRPIVAQ
jgi:hypothetical protein